MADSELLKKVMILTFSWRMKMRTLLLILAVLTVLTFTSCAPYDNNPAPTQPEEEINSTLGTATLGTATLGGGQKS